MATGTSACASSARRHRAAQDRDLGAAGPTGACSRWLTAGLREDGGVAGEAVSGVTNDSGRSAGWLGPCAARLEGGSDPGAASRKLPASQWIDRTRRSDTGTVPGMRCSETEAGHRGRPTLGRESLPDGPVEQSGTFRAYPFDVTFFGGSQQHQLSRQPVLIEVTASVEQPQP